MTQDSTRAAIDAAARGFVPIPVNAGNKRPALAGWTHQRWTKDEDGSWNTLEKAFEEWHSQGFTNLGVLLGDPSSGLVDVDLDHPKTARLKNHFLPPTSARSGRDGRPGSHYWYVCREGTLPGTRRHKMPDQSVSVELRSNLAQTVIAPSVHPSGESYRWETEPWGGDEGPTVVDGRLLAVQVALLGLGTILVDAWPQEGGRHDAYLALAGGLLSYGDSGVHPYWERNSAVLIRALAEATLDEDGPDAREAEVLGTTIKALRNGGRVVGFGTLAEYLGNDVVKQVRVMVGEVESAAGFQSRQAPSVDVDPVRVEERRAEIEEEIAHLPAEERDPLTERVATWEPVDLDPYLLGVVKPVMPSVLTRDDGESLMYPGRVNMLYGSSESAKSWIALKVCIQEIAKGERALYLDFEDEPVSTLSRLRALGAGTDDLRLQFSYVRPEEPLAPMQRSKWGEPKPSPLGDLNQSLFEKALETLDPSIIIADGMTVLYGLHGLDTNDSVATDVITTWLKKLTRNGRTTVIVIDHTAKAPEKGSMPIGSQHKVSMVQGSMLQVWPITQPMPGAIGEVELVVLKDRPGQVRAISQKSGKKAQVSAVIKMDSMTPGVTTMTIAPPRMPKPPTASTVDVDLAQSKEAERAEAFRRVEDAVLYCYRGELGKGFKLIELEDQLAAYETKVVKAAVKRLMDKGYITAQGNTRARLYVLDIGDSAYAEATGKLPPDAPPADAS